MAASAPPSFAPGSLVRARGRDWVVLPPGEDPEILLLRPLGGTEDDVAGLYLPFEGAQVEPATIPAPDPSYVGDAVSASLLRDAVRLGFRSGAGPLRSLARIAVEPRPYQLVPLLMALRQDPVRLLIGDDVGIGKTIEAALIARELLDRGEIRRLAVLCPPHLCEQWQTELRDKFHVDAVVVRPGTVASLERQAEREHGLDLSRTLFEIYPFVVVSIDYIKSDRRREGFVRTCAECVIVDEAHTVAAAVAGRSAQHQRHSLVNELAADPERHLIFTTATPHSGDQQAFASLVGLLAPDLEQAVLDLEYGAGTGSRERLAAHFVQRRRADIRLYLGAETDFPERIVLQPEPTYKLSPAYRRLMEHVLDYASEMVQTAEGGTAFQRRVSWWAALALLRCVSSSPAAAAAALRTRARPLVENPDAADRLGAAAVLDLEQAEESTQDDSTPGADTVPEDDPAAPERARLLALAQEAEGLKGTEDPKLAEATRILRGLFEDGFSPIVFCRYIATAHYVAEELQRRLRGVTVMAVTGELPPEEREKRVTDLAAAPKHLLVATDCLSEGINLQHGFDAVVHYDLAWNPTRHEQREGRVDRYGQPRREVRTALLYGQDNRVDGAVMEVLLRKAENIRKTLGVSVPVPTDTEKVLEAIFDRLFGAQRQRNYQQLNLFQDEQRDQVAAAWDAAAERERRTRTIFAQHALHPDLVKAELDEAVDAIGGGEDVRRFVEEAALRLGAPLIWNAERTLGSLDLRRLPAAIHNRFEPDGKPLRIGFDPSVPSDAVYVNRTHPLVEGLGSYLLDLALDLPAEAVASRAGAMRTAAVAERTVLLLLRGRYLIREAGGRELLAEEALLLGFRGDPSAPQWLHSGEATRLSREAIPVGNVVPQQASLWIQQVLGALPSLQQELDAIAQRRADELLNAHQRVRQAARLRGRGQRVEAKTPFDNLGIYVLMPAPVA